MLSTEQIIRLEFEEVKDFSDEELKEWMDKIGHKLKWISQKELKFFIERIFLIDHIRVDKNVNAYLKSIVEYFNIQFELDCFNKPEVTQCDLSQNNKKEVRHSSH